MSTPTLQRSTWAPVVALGLAMLVVTSELTIVAVTLPGIGSAFGVSPATTAWVLLSYALPMAAVAIPAGRWADTADVRSVLAIAMIGIGAASVLSAVAPWFWLVIVGRLLQGCAASLVVAAYMPIVTASVRPEQRGKAVGVIMTIMTVGGMAGVPIGGLIAGAFSWREVFLMKLPLLAVVLWAGLRTVPRMPDRGLPRPGAVLLRESLLLGGAIAGLLLAVDELDGRPVVAALLFAAAAASAWWWTRLPASGPVLVLVRTPAVATSMTSLMATSFTAGLISFLVPYFVADVMRLGPNVTGMALLFFIGALAPLSLIAGALADRYGTRLIAIIGSVVSVVAMATMFTLGDGSGFVDLVWRLVLLGVGAALFNAAINTAIMAAAPSGSEGVVGGVAMTARTIAMTMGPALAALAWSLADGGTVGFRSGVAVITVGAVVGLVVLLLPAAKVRA